MTHITKTQRNGAPRDWEEQRREGYSSSRAVGIIMLAFIAAVIGLVVLIWSIFGG